MHRGVVVGLGAAMVVSAAAASADGPARNLDRTAPPHEPVLRFVENRGQADAAFPFVAHTRDYTALLAADRICITSPHPPTSAN